VAIWPAPANPIHVGQRMFVRAVELAREHGTGWHTHCSEASTDPEMYLEAHGLRPVEWLAKEGLLGPDATLAHAIWLDDGEIERVGETRSGVSYNPASNAYLGAGVMRLRELRSAGARVGLGTDGLAVAGPTVLRCMEHAVLQQRQRSLDPAASGAEEALELATRGGARYLGIDAGVVAAGTLADLAVFDLGRLHLRPVGDVTAAMVYAVEASDVTMTIVGGRIVYEGGRCVSVDEDALLAEVDARAEALARRAGLVSAPARHRTTREAGGDEGGTDGGPGEC
jgi:5-methylthioadenosine/S-adenosylhomocysteine deaminase